MKPGKLRLKELKVRSFTINLDISGMHTVKGGDETTPDPTPITTTDEPIKVPPTGLFCPTGGINWCPVSG